MRITLATIGSFHIFPLARELERLGVLERVYSGFPWSRLRREGVSRDKVRTFPFVRPFVMGLRLLPFDVPEVVADSIHEFSLVTLDHFVARSLPDGDVYVGHEGAGLVSGAEAQRRGMLYVCDRGCTHMAWREELLQAEHDRLGLPPRRRPNTYEREIEEYDRADLIVVPSEFARASFIEKGVSEDKLAVVPYGVDLQRFHPVGRPADVGFQIVFVGYLSVRKGAGDLLTAFKLANIPGKRLLLIGQIEPDVMMLYADLLNRDDVTTVGHVPNAMLKAHLGESHVFCLPSLEEGQALVVCEAMACGCAPVVTANTGATSIVHDGANGYVVPIRAPEDIAAHFERLAADRELRDRLGAAALASVRELGGWSAYGGGAVAAYRRALARRAAGRRTDSTPAPRENRVGVH
ncbi:MAG: glycosyltransferase [Hyphomicrobiales bacterium]|nr:glycosyltransferase [Hyphomicrobiales bacterium]